MNDAPSIDVTKSLAEITGVDWGPPPINGGSLMQERHILRRRPLVQWSHAELIRFLTIGCDHNILIPVALARLEQDPEASADSGSGELLCAVLRQQHFWRQAQPSAIVEIRAIAERALAGMFEITDDFTRLCVERALYESLWRFEVSLSQRSNGDGRNA